MKTSSLLFSVVLFLLTYSMAHADSGLPAPYRIGGNITINDKLVTQSNDDGLLIVVKKADGTDYKDDSGKIPQDDDGVKAVSNVYIVDIPIHSTINQPGGANTGESAKIHVFMDGTKLTVTSPANGLITIGESGVMVRVNIQAQSEQIGALQVSIDPADAVTAGAQWRRVGTTTWLSSGATESGLASGNITIEFLDIAGWNTPPNQIINIIAGQTATFTGTYSHQTSTSQLNVNKTGTGTGTITSDPAGINCGGDCSQSYVENTIVTLTATPSQESDFIGWTGAYTGKNNPCSVTMAAAKSITAQFDLKALPILYVTPGTQNVGADDGSTAFDVSNTGTGTLSWTASVTAGNDWLAISPPAGGTNSGTITCTFDENTAETPRTAVIRVTATGATGSPKDISVTQSGTNPILLTGLTITGKDVVGENSEAYYTAHAEWSDGTVTVVTPGWWIESASPPNSYFFSDGALSVYEPSGNQKITLRASYTSGESTAEASYPVTIVDVTELTNCQGTATHLEAKNTFWFESDCHPFDFENPNDYVGLGAHHPNRAVINLCDCIDRGMWESARKDDVIDIRMEILVEPLSGTEGLLSGDNGVYWAEDINPTGIPLGRYSETTEACAAPNPFNASFAGDYEYLTTDYIPGTPLLGTDFLCDSLTATHRVTVIRPQPTQTGESGYTINQEDADNFNTAWVIDIPKMRIDPMTVPDPFKLWVRVCLIRGDEYCCQDVCIGKYNFFAELFSEKGDINDDWEVDLVDAVLCLKIMGGMPAGDINPFADVDNNGSLGLSDLIYIMETISGLR